MDIVYVVGRKERENYLNLRMSLRSINRFGSGIDKVIVVGFPPKWLSTKVIARVVPDRYLYKHSNILFCLEQVVAEGLVQGDFLYSSADHFYVKPVDFNSYPVYIKGELRRNANKSDSHYQYHRSLYDTYLLCVKHGLPTLNYAQHCNTHMHSEVIKDIHDIILESYDFPYGVEPTSIVMNAWQTSAGAPKSQKRTDLKLASAESVGEILIGIGENECFSIADSIYNNRAIYDFFHTEYPIKSIYEK